jgi:hypothetical protein
LAEVLSTSARYPWRAKPSANGYESRITWIYASNITQFHYFDLEFADPSNVVLLQIIHPEQPQLLDLAPLGGGPVKVRFEIPLRAERMDK